jgi:hypothetical protein
LHQLFTTKEHPLVIAFLGRGKEVKACMQENCSPEDMFAKEEQAQTQQDGAPVRRVVEEQQTERRLAQQSFDFSGVDFVNNTQIRQSVTRAARILIDIAQKRRRAGGA